MEVFGIRILGLGPEGLRKLALSAAVLLAAWLIRRLLRAIRLRRRTSRGEIWTRKGARLAIGAVATLLLLSIWFDDPGRLATFIGLIGAGLAFAAQNVVLSIAGYLVIVFGRTFDVGHRIELGGVRGDVLDIGLVKTTIMEMGVPAALIPEPNHWVSARQYTGRVVSVVNAEVFRQPVFNYTLNFDLLWEEMRVPIRYGTDLGAAERILLEAARAETCEATDLARSQLAAMRARYLIEPGDLEPRVFVRLTDDWIELSLRFLTSTHGIRAQKDRIARAILVGFESAKISVASATIDLVGAPEVRVRIEETGGRTPPAGG